VSLDAATERDYQRIRGLAALTVVERGVARLRRLGPEVSVSARATLHRLNFRELPALIDHAKAMALDGISFLAADVSTLAFGRERPDRIQALTLSRAEVAEFRDRIEETIDSHADDFASGFVAESPDRLRRLAQYYGALAGYAPFPAVSCNAPYVSVVIEADGIVRPCFFHQMIGSIRQESLAAIVQRNLPAFRETLNVSRNPVCARCVCSLKTSWKQAPWH
jgi:MoaA/NifB/PqqE/SkfB family radical SAM enzyme